MSRYFIDQNYGDNASFGFRPRPGSLLKCTVTEIGTGTREPTVIQLMVLARRLTRAPPANADM